MTANFDNAIAGDARLQARWDATREKVQADARAAGLGEIDPESLKSLAGIKLAVFTDMGLPSDLLDEVKRLPEVADTLRKLEIKRQLESGDSDLHADLDRMNRYQRLTFGRELESAKAAERAAMQKPAAMTAEDEAKFLLMLRRLPPSERMSAARAAGLLQ